MEQYKEKVKKSIEELISNNNLKEAKKIITEYEEVVHNDVDIYSFKGVIFIMEGNIGEAESVLMEGYEIYQTSFDILYNLGYLYQYIGNNELAIKYYKQSLINSTNESKEDAAYNSLISLGIEQNKDDIINDIIAQKYFDEANNFDDVGNKSDAVISYGLAYRYSKGREFKNEICNLLYNNSQELKSIFDVVANAQKKRFIILSSCDWSDTYQRMHHISRSLVKLGNEVIYIAPTTLVDINVENISLDDLVEHSINNIRIVDSVKIYSPILASYNKKIIGNNYSFLVQNLLDLTTDASKTIIVTYMPYQVDAINTLKGDFMHIYDCVDDHSDLDYAFWGNKKDVIWEQDLMDKADATTTTSTSLYLQRAAIEGRKNIYLSRNAVNEGDFIFADENIPEDLKNIPEPRIVYTGVVYKRYDEKLFYDVVDSNPDKSFVIIGPIIDGMLREKRDNIYLLGPKKHSELKDYLKYMKVGIVPYIDTANMDIACDSIKQYEYIACGLPVITTYMPESAMNKIYTFLANTKEEFNEAIEKCLKLKVDKNKISNFISENSWNARAALLCNIADNKVSDSEKEILIKNIENELVNICSKYKSSIFEILKSMCFNLRDSKQFENSARLAYNKLNNKYIEKQYLISLLKNKEVNKFIEVASNSSYIREEIKRELLLCKERNDINKIQCLSCICIDDLREAQKLMKKLENDDRLTYEVYINYILGENIIYRKLDSITNKNQESPLFQFLRKIARMQEILVSL